MKVYGTLHARERLMTRVENPHFVRAVKKCLTAHAREVRTRKWVIKVYRHNKLIGAAVGQGARWTTTLTGTMVPVGNSLSLSVYM
jgi:hypothetical protein